MTTEMSRRDALTAMTASAAGFAGLGSIASAASSSTRAAGAGALVDLGYDERRGEYTLPDLPYDYDALEPHIDARTMTVHHDKHHAGYVRGLNKALEVLHDIRWNKGDPATLQHWERELSFHAGGHINHTLFWTGMAPERAGGGGRPEGDLGDAIADQFGSYEKFAWNFRAAAGSVEGSGWGWLVYEPIGKRLMVTQMENQQKLMFAGAVPLLGVDVWEHAYYLRYENRRGDYLEAFMNVVNWPEIQRRFDAARA